MKGDQAPDDQAERAVIRDPTGAKRQNSQPELRSRKQIGKHICFRFEINPDDARDQAWRDDQNDRSSQGDDAMDDEQDA
jgi:hypothetical protein